MLSQSSSITDIAGLIPKHLILLYQQTTIGMECLGAKLNLSKPPVSKSQPNTAKATSAEILPYLIHASILLFTWRDNLVFEMVRTESSFEQSGLGEKIRQIPSYAQLVALLGSRQLGGLLALVKPFSDDSLGIVDLKVFRDAIIQQGIPHDAGQDISQTMLEETEVLELFSLPVVRYTHLAKDMLAAWQVLEGYRQAEKPLTV